MERGLVAVSAERGDQLVVESLPFETTLLLEPPACRAGLVGVSERPGLGADPNPQALARYPYERAAARPFYLT